jgi:hypothetical protein
MVDQAFNAAQTFCQREYLQGLREAFHSSASVRKRTDKTPRCRPADIF